MKIAIVSDTHNNLANINKAISWINKEGISLLLHCGDTSSKEAMREIEKNFKGEAKFAKGNADFDLDLPDQDEAEVGGKKIGFAHFPELAKKMAQSGKYDMVFYGHTHRAWDEIVNAGGKKCHMINPGELAGQFYKPTFAVYDTGTGKLELKILEKLPLD